MNEPAQPGKGNLIVVAGAGTGKTYKLVQRCIEGLRAGVEIDEMLIVTFTKAAAAELRERIGKALEGEFAANPDSPHWARQIALLDRAQISTLHSYCLELVSRHFSELGLSPRLTTLEGAQAAALRNEAMEGLFETFYDAQTGPAGEIKKMLVNWFHGDDRQAREIVLQLHEFTQTRPDPAGWFAAQRAALASEDPIEWRRLHIEAIEQWVKRWRPSIEAQPAGANNPAREKVLACMDKFDVGRIAEIFDDEDCWPRGSKKHYRKPFEKVYREAATLAGWKRSGESDPLREDWDLIRDVTRQLLDVAEEFSRQFAALKLERGCVDFHDLEQFSLRLLWRDGQPSEIARDCRRRLKWIFVDEYQDINCAQDRIIEALARDAANGNRFLVGDVKQSIYGFRQAEPEIFCRYENAWNGGAEGSREYLVNNWRSHERILDFVNGLFASLMNGQVGGVIYDAKARLAFASRETRSHLSRDVDPLPKVSVHLVRKSAADANAAEDGEEDERGNAGAVLADFHRAEAEAHVVADICRRLVEVERVVLPSGARVGYGDIVILMRAAASEVEAFAKVFSRRQIPFDARRTGFFNCIEVLDLTNLLTILDNPLQDIPLLGVLRSPFGCFSLEDLASIRATAPRVAFWEALTLCAESASDAEAGAAREKAREFISKFERWRNLSRNSNLAQRLEAILEETGYEDWVGAQDRGAQRRANVRRLLELARQFDQARGEGLYPFLQHIEEQMDAVGDIAPASVDSHGAVRLMTVHQSKGLQFPVVIMAGLSKRFNAQDFNRVSLLDDERGLCLKARPPGKRRQYETLAFWMARRKQEQKLLDEEMRILYVALTRAEHQLMLVGAPSKSALSEWGEGGKRLTAACSMLDWIGPWLTRDCPAWLDAESGAANDWRWQWHDCVSDAQARDAEEGPAEVAPEALAALKQKLDWKYPFLPASRQEAKSSATALRRALADEPELARPLVKPAARAKTGLAANQVGAATHHLLQHARFEAFDSAETLREEIERLRVGKILTEDEAAAISAEKILSFWATDFGRELRKHSARLARELEFTAKFRQADLRAAGAPIQSDFGDEDFIVVQGAADLVAIFENELWLVDFKTDRIPEELVASRARDYALQLKIYALALRRIYRRPVTRACLHFLEHGRTEWIDVEVSPDICR